MRLKHSLRSVTTGTLQGGGLKEGRPPYWLAGISPGVPPSDLVTLKKSTQPNSCVSAGLRFKTNTIRSILQCRQRDKGGDLTLLRTTVVARLWQWCGLLNRLYYTMLRALALNYGLQKRAARRA